MDGVKEIVVAGQFRGPPNSGNGGYVCGLLAHDMAGPVRAMLRAPIPLDTPLRLCAEGGQARLTSLAGDLIAEATAGDPADLPQPPPAPDLARATAAAARFVGHDRPFHPICFTCATVLEEGFGLRVFVGQLEGADDGVVAGPWTPHANFGDAEGLATMDTVWAALDCPGSVAWVVNGGGAGLLGTMVCEVLRRPAVGEPCIVVAWPIEASGRKRVAGTALYAADGELLARSRQIWIGRAA